MVRGVPSHDRALHADLAQQTGVQQLAVGTELAGTSSNTAKWREVIDGVRAKYKGKITYAANYDEYEKISFWDALDYIGIDAYWPLESKPTSDVNALVSAWQPIAAKLKALSKTQGKQILFTEAGYASQQGSVVTPWDHEASTVKDDAEQAAAYEALARVFWSQPWFAGVHWWMWDDIPGRTDDKQELDYTPHGKPAEDILRRMAQATAN